MWQFLKVFGKSIQFDIYLIPALTLYKKQIAKACRIDDVALSLWRNDRIHLCFRFDFFLKINFWLKKKKKKKKKKQA